MICIVQYTLDFIMMAVNINLLNQRKPLVITGQFESLDMKDLLLLPLSVNPPPPQSILAFITTSSLPLSFLQFLIETLGVDWEA